MAHYLHIPTTEADVTDAQRAQLALLTVNDICKLLRVGRSWVYASAKRGEFPRPAIQSHRLSRWREADVASWVAAQAVLADPTPQARDPRGLAASFEHGAPAANPKRGV